MAPYYVWNGTAYVEMDAAAVRAAPPAKPHPTAAEIDAILEHPKELEEKIKQLFAQYAGSDRALQFSEMQAMVVSIAHSLGVGMDEIGELRYLFARFDYSRDGALQLEEATALIKSVIEVQRLKQVKANQKDKEVGGYAAGDSAEIRVSGSWTPCTIEEVRDDGAIKAKVFSGAAYVVPKALRHSMLRVHGAAPVVVSINKPVAEGNPSDALEHLAGEVHAVIMWNDYNWLPDWGRGMDTSHGGRIMENFLRSCGVKDITVLSRMQCTPQNLGNAIYTVGQRCQPHDTFVFYYTGHGERIPDNDGDELDGMDEALCTVHNGVCNQSTWVRDDDLADWLTTYVKAHNIFVIVDACHSASIVDLNKNQWRHKNAMSMSGCQDVQESAGTGFGGLFTHSIEKAGQKVRGQKGISAAHFYNVVLQEAQTMKAQYHSQQDIAIQTPAHVHPEHLEWPLIPQ
eukprot:TRINITY_DN6671_c1_g6_i1.p1 TRINITY_DN6671_c1_g6~~TRINITY_DN6671_c1_g6_i1.p1  ORF type:complete len:481 (-),score=99.76 TRINITY_DN6671_c1_g6_i1:294-1661(-)